jgi:tRNA1(Val) A37 N6-methylase TrmN6
MYRSQVNLSHRTSQSVMLQQYSTPAPIAFLAGSFVKSNRYDAAYFEPSAGNGLLTIALPYEGLTVNEIDEFRSKNLAEQPFSKQLHRDATEPFGMDKQFDGIITNPPFGKLDKALTFDGFPIYTLDHAMAVRALDCMKDDGRAAIIIGGHTEWDSAGRIRAGKNRIFFSYLYRHYHVADVINIDGDLYSRQGTSFDVRLILIDGRKAVPDGYPPLKDADDKTVKDFDTLFERVAVLIDEIGNADTDHADKTGRLRTAKAKAVAKLKILESEKAGTGSISGLKTKNTKLSPYTIAANCTDFTDCKSGAHEIIEAQQRCELAGKKIPAWYASRLKKIDRKAILKYGAAVRWIMDVYGEVYGHWNFTEII